MLFYWIQQHIRKLRSDFLGSVMPHLSRSALEEAFDGFTIRHRVYHTWPLFQTFLSQVASGAGCREAIECAINQGWLPLHASPKTSAYCNARSRLPEAPLKDIALSSGALLERGMGDGGMFLGRTVKVIDGSSVQLPDTEQNQREYPQPNQQKPGCGFPVMFLSALMGLASGAILDAEVCGGSGHERTSFRTLWRSLEAGDIVLGDAGYGSYAEVAMLEQRGVDTLFRKGARKLDTRGAVRLSKDDWLVIWHCPPTPGDWVTVEELPEMMVMRAVRFRHRVKGFRSREVILYTTLVDPERYPKAKLIELYRRRWEMELRLRDIKTYMGLELLRCKTPGRCRKELWMGLLAYNLIRTVMADAALKHKVNLTRISFAGTVQRLEAFGAGYIARHDPYAAYQLLLQRIAIDLLPYRPDRIEPRKKKRREKNYRKLNKPRQTERLLLLKP